jgi:hypothetical protein
MPPLPRISYEELWFSTGSMRLCLWRAAYLVAGERGLLGNPGTLRSG